MPAFSNANDKTAIIAIRVKILFFLIKSILNINNLFIKFIYKMVINQKHYNNYDGPYICGRFSTLHSILYKGY